MTPRPHSATPPADFGIAGEAIPAERQRRLEGSLQKHEREAETTLRMTGS